MTEMLLGELIPCGGGDPIPLVRHKLLIGRRDSCDILLRFPNISSHHCQLELINGYWFVKDLGSRNGIKVNGTRCDQKWLLPGDELTVAKHRYEIQYHTNGTAPPTIEEEENPMQVSLLEKAGLLRRSDRERPSSRNVPSPPPKPVPKPRPASSNSQEDQIMGWLEGND